MNAQEMRDDPPQAQDDNKELDAQLLVQKCGQSCGAAYSRLLGPQMGKETYAKSEIMTRRKRRTVPTLDIRADIAADKYTADYYGPASGPYKPGRHSMWCGYFAGYLAGWAARGRAAKREKGK